MQITEKEFEYLQSLFEQYSFAAGATEKGSQLQQAITVISKHLDIPAMKALFQALEYDIAEKHDFDEWQQRAASYKKDIMQVLNAR